MGQKSSAVTQSRERPQRGWFRTEGSYCRRWRLHIAVGPTEADDCKTVSLAETLVKESSVGVSVTQTIGPSQKGGRKRQVTFLDAQPNQRPASLSAQKLLYGDTINILHNHRPETDPPEQHRLRGEGPSQVQVGYEDCLAYMSRINRTHAHKSTLSVVSFSSSSDLF
jgi:hypothetical protein